MVHTTCAMRDCLSSSRIDKKLRFHQFPHTAERCKIWVESCSRPDLVDKTCERLKNTYICSLHFERRMYGKKSLKKIAVPTLLLPTNESTSSIYSQTDLKNETVNGVTFKLPKKRRILKPKVTEKYNELAGFSSQIVLAGITQDEKYLSTEHGTETTPRSTDRISRRRKLKRVFISEKCDVTEKQFLEGCDKFLAPKLSAIVKAQIYLKPHCKNNRYTSEFKLFCLKMYYTSPLAYRFLSKTICLPSKSTLANMYLPMETRGNQQMWDVLTATIKHMSTSEKECVLCMDEMKLKLNLELITKEGKQELGQQQIDAARFAFTLMLRGVTSTWEQPISFYFLPNSGVDDSLKTWIIDTAKNLLHLGFNIRAFVSDIKSEFVAFSKMLNISKECSCFEVEGHKIYYMFDVPHLMKSVRNNLMKYNFEFDDKTARWEDIKNMYELDKINDMRAAPRLTDSHIHPKSCQKQKVRFAVQVFSHSVLAGLMNYASLGAIEIANGTIFLIETMNNLFDLFNSSNIDSQNYFNKPYRGDNSQEELLCIAQHLFNSMKVKNKCNGRDVTINMKFINGFLVTINSLRELYKDMNSEGYEYMLTRRLNNDCMENFFRLVRQAGGNRWEPTRQQYARAFRKIFLCHILNLSDSTNCTEDFDNIITQYVDFTKKSRQLHDVRDPIVNSIS